MKFLVVLSVAFAAVNAVSFEQLFKEEWSLYKAEHQKSYESPFEDYRRMRAFMDNKLEVAEHNLKFKKGETTYEMEINEYSDWLPEELAARNGFNRDIRERLDAGEEAEFPELDALPFELPPNATAPDNFSWVEKGVVAPVKNQGSCGSCYAFSALGALESQQYMKTKKMVRLSEQNIVDCSGKYGNMGCNGGSACRSYNYIKDNGGVNTESAYPYEGKQGKCRYNSKHIGATCAGYVKVDVNEEKLKLAIANVGPVSVAIHTMDSFNRYRSGIYSEPKCKSDIRNLNHAVLLVGYGIDSSTKQPYWLVKNSWGTAWGEKGYIRMRRNNNNMCGIASYALYPKI